MSKEIDFSKAPEGATHYRKVQDHVDWYRKTNSDWQYWRASYNSWVYGATWFYSALPIPQQWSIYTNDKPLSELSDEQAAALFNAWRSGQVRQTKDDYGWCDSPIKVTAWIAKHVYRIKQKSEREMFVDKVSKIISDPMNAELFKVFSSALFDNGCRFIKDAE